MSANFFLDTNLLVYAIGSADPRKQAVALDWVEKAHESGSGLVSYQVVQEWFNVVLRKAAAPLTLEDATSIYRQVIRPLWRIQSSPELIETAIHLHREHSISWWDSLIVSAAIQGDCRTILSEDLQHGQTIQGVQILNPFESGS